MHAVVVVALKILTLVYEYWTSLTKANELISDRINYPLHK